jgi:hypothetical protein
MKNAAAHNRPGSTALRIAGGLALISCLSSGPKCIAAGPDFDRDIRPILSDRCYFCHGPDAERREAELRLDTRAGAVEFAIVPGAPDSSELIARITSDDPDYRMPPPASHLTLTDDEKRLLQEWIEAGAEYTEHWAFKPLPAEVAVPAVRDDTWPRQTLDRFVLARLEAEALPPSPVADPLRILRRVSLDLAGLPPTVAEIEAFRAQAASDLPGAIAAAVDRLLASPAYGEHMAIAWLDAARYADSYGYQSDQLNGQWPYRDWVVQAFNANLPYDQFLAKQIAGDLLPEATRNDVLATAFNRMHRMTNEGGSIAEEWLVENASDRIHTLGTAVLGLTVECARCHDHKYDPISQRDYYALSAFFNSIDENGMYDNASKTPAPSLMQPTPEQERVLTAASEEIARAEKEVVRAREEGEARFREWLGGRPTAAVDQDLCKSVSFDGDESVPRLKAVAGAQGQAVQFDGDVGAVFPDAINIDRWQPFSINFWLRDSARNPQPVVLAHQTRGTDVGYNGFDLMLADGVLEARLYRVWPGNAIGIRAERALAADEWQHVAVVYDGSSRATGLRLYLAGEELPTVVVRDRIEKSAAAIGHGDGHFGLGARFRDRGFKGGAIDELRVFDRALSTVEIAELHHRGTLGEALAAPAAHEASLRDYYFSAIDSEARRAAKNLRNARRRFVETQNEVHEVAVMRELPEPRPAYILARGTYDAPKHDDNRVDRDTFAEMLIPFPAAAPRDRRGLAEWLTDPRHPLTARVFVNRLWANFFGQALVATPENFGRQGSAPSHPELLDWLARDFVDHGWDVKRLCRQIVLSATYQQDSRLRPELRDRDPENTLLARGSSRRLSAEQIRDLALAAANLLDHSVGGPPVSPYQPGEDLWRESNAMSPPYRQSTGKALHRRSLYSVWKRTAPLPNMLAFDAGTREVCTVARSRTNTPLQALVLLNDAQFVEAAAALAADVARTHTDLGGQIDAAFLRLTGRKPTDQEQALLEELFAEQLELFRVDGEQPPAALLEAGEARFESTLPRADLAALTAVCQAILNLDATVYER